MYRNLLSKQPGLKAVRCPCHLGLAQESSYRQPNRSSPSDAPQHLPAPRSLRRRNLAELLFKYTSASRAESQPDRKAVGTEGSCSLLSVSSAGEGGGKKKGKKKRQVGLAKRLPAKETAHERSRHFVWRFSTLAPSILPPRLAGLQRESQLTRGRTPLRRCSGYAGHGGLPGADGEGTRLRNHRAQRICYSCFLRKLKPFFSWRGMLRAKVCVCLLEFSRQLSPSLLWAFQGEGSAMG